MKVFYLLICCLTGALLLLATEDFPSWADPHSPANRAGSLSAYYIEQSMADTSIPNMVTAVLADYRGFDTMLETSVVLTAGLAIILLLRSVVGKEEDEVFEDSSDESVEGGDNPNVIIQTTCKLLIPPMQLFALYVLAHGHHSPGGGFQGGVILGATLILHAIAFELQTTLKSFTQRIHIMFSTLGVFIYAGIGLLCLFIGANFLDYSVLSHIFPVSPIEARSLAVLGVEIGVAFTVMAVMFSIYADLSSRGRLHKGL